MWENWRAFCIKSQEKNLEGIDTEQILKDTEHIEKIYQQELSSVKKKINYEGNAGEKGTVNYSEPGRLSSVK